MKFTVNASRKELESVGIEIDLTGKVGDLVKVFPTGYFELRFDLPNVGKINFDLPRNFVNQVIEFDDENIPD